ncbi:uncharacterized protein LOC117172584 isoform X1 [Belonocnema kinseyi]|uniref:uncharacterized protein LOC117172584 isoform X1 n=1 Tax=Belonocnema kinseyi TaxID=2817044 RepID=UPI00143D7F6E|nr:uncharacterized protein LOC117172584 isoform X1 [Belonocnema kinseyi]
MACNAKLVTEDDLILYMDEFSTDSKTNKNNETPKISDRLLETDNTYNPKPTHGPEIDDLDPDENPPDVESDDRGIDDGFLSERPNKKPGYYPTFPKNPRPADPELPSGFVPDVNVYQQKKTIAEGMMNLALIIANGTQFRYVLQSSDKITSTKLNFAFLQYSALEFYSIPETDTFNSRELLLALGWLFSSNNAIDTTFRSKIINSSLGKESSSQVSAQKPLEKIQLFSAEDQMKNIVHTCTKLNHNLKQISELISEKIKLATKVHAASINASGLPHLSVFEMALTKRLSSQKKNSEDQETIWSLQNLSTMIDLHPKWIKKQHIFFEWMISVIEESKSAQKPIITEESCLEIFKFTTCLRHFVKKKMHNLKRNLDEIPNFDSAPDCVSRLLRIQNSETEAENWVEKAKKNLELTEKEIELKEKDLLKELKSMLKLIQNCVRV